MLGRALQDVRERPQRPVHRRVPVRHERTEHDWKQGPTRNRPVWSGDVIGKYHPHGRLGCL